MLSEQSPQFSGLMRSLTVNVIPCSIQGREVRPLFGSKSMMVIW